MQTRIRKRGGHRAALSRRGVLQRVLVADDDTDTTVSLCQLVRLWGHEAQAAFSGHEAMELAFVFRPTVLLLDIAMPGMNGYDLARRLSEDSLFDHALFIAVTGYADDAHRVMGAIAGFDHYLVKPADPAAIEQLLRGESTIQAGSRERDPRAEAWAEQPYAIPQ